MLKHENYLTILLLYNFSLTEEQQKTLDDV